MTGAQEQAITRLRKRKSKLVVKGTVNSEVQVEWTEKDVFNEDRVVKATIAENGMMAEIR